MPVPTPEPKTPTGNAGTSGGPIDDPVAEKKEEPIVPVVAAATRANTSPSPIAALASSILNKNDEQDAKE